MIIELRGLIRFKHNGIEKRQLVTRGQRGDNYKWTNYPASKPLTLGAIKSYLSKELKVKIKDIIVPEHIKI